VKMGLAKFYFFSTVGILIWNTLWISIGSNLGENWQRAEDFSQVLDWVAYVLVALVLIYAIISLVKQLRSRS